MDKNRRSIVKYYKSTIKQNLGDILEILQSVGVDSEKYIGQYSEIFDSSSDYIVDKWNKGKKYIRTEFVMGIFGDLYPRKVLPVSIMIDSMINILDDLFDEQLTRDDRKIYILEYLRVYAVYSTLPQSEKIRKCVGSYFDKLITLAIAEQDILREAEKTDNLDILLELSTKLLLIRARDIDIFVQVVLDRRNINDLSILDSARYFRSLNLLKKDILDFDHDIKNDQQTLVTYVRSKKELVFENYIKSIIEYFKRLFADEEKRCKKDCVKAYENLKEMIDEESDKLLELAKE